MTLMIAICSLAILGIVYRSLFTGRLRKLSVTLYIVMGWLIVIAAREPWVHVPHKALAYMVEGGLCYTLGVVFFGWNRLPYHYAIRHLFVLGGSALHYFAVLLYLA